MIQEAQLHPVLAGTDENYFDINAVNNELRYDVRAWSVVSVSAVKLQATWSTGVLTVYRSLDGCNPFALESSETLGPGDDITASLDVSGFPYLIVRLTTVEGTQRFVRVCVRGKVSA